MSLKDKLNAKAEEVDAKQKSDAEEDAQYKLKVMREVPRVFNELLSMVRSMTAGVKGVTINADNSVRDVKVGEHVMGRAQVSEFSVSFIGRTIAFQDTAGPWMGVRRKIEVVATGAANPFEKGLNVLENRANPEEWHIWVPGNQGPGPRVPGRGEPVRLTAEVLEQHLESFFTT